VLRKILVFALIFKFMIGSSAAFSNPPSLIETSNLSQTQQRALTLFEAGKAAHDGINVPQDYEKARLLYLEAANLGSNPALINLGYLYFTGQGVKKNLIKAREFYEIAAARGSEDAKANLKMMDARGLGIIPAAGIEKKNPGQAATTVKAPVSVKSTAPFSDTMKRPEAQAIDPAIGTKISNPDKLDVTRQSNDTTLIASDIKAVPSALKRNFETAPNSTTLGSNKIAALLISLGGFLILIYFIIDKKNKRDRAVREKFVQFFYEAKRSDLRLTYLRRRSEGYVQANFFKEWHATLTVLMARYAVTFDEPDEALRAFCQKLNHGLNLNLRPTQHLASEFSDEMMRAARSEVKAVDAFHMAKITEGASPSSSQKIHIPSPPKSLNNVVKLFQRKSV